MRSIFEANAECRVEGKLTEDQEGKLKNQVNNRVSI